MPRCGSAHRINRDVAQINSLSLAADDERRKGTMRKYALLSATKHLSEVCNECDNDAAAAAAGAENNLLGMRVRVCISRQKCDISATKGRAVLDAAESYSVIQKRREY